MATKVRRRTVQKVGLTPYKAAMLVNQALKEAKIGKTIPPQMMYNYTSARVRNGERPFIEYSPSKGVDRADFQRWLSEYIDRMSSVTEK